MNIFIFNEDPSLAAKDMCDKHIVKMALETAQLMCTALNLNNINTPYKTTHINHPCSLWTRENRSNFEWLYEHGIAICNEYTDRYYKTHKCEQIIIECIKYKNLLSNKPLSQFVLAMPEKYKTNSAVISYRNYFIGEKSNIAHWKNGNIPEWYKRGHFEIKN